MTDHDDLYALLDRAVGTLGPVPDLVPAAAAEGRRRRHRARLATAGAALAVAATLVAVPFVFGGLGDGTAPADQPTPTSQPWVEPADYSFVLDSRCGERTLFGRFAITVSDHRVADVVGRDEFATVVVGDPELRKQVPTLGMLVEQYRQAVRDGADEATLVSAGADRHPVTITIDYDEAAMDDEACYTITDYAVAGA